MDRDRLEALLNQVASGELPPGDAINKLKHMPYVDLPYAKIDCHRTIRQGLPEVIYCPGKTVEQVAEIATRLKEHHRTIVATKAEADFAARVLHLLPDGRYLKDSRILIWGTTGNTNVSSENHAVNVVTAGTADVPIAEEAALFLELADIYVKRLYDVGVAGLHRLLDNLESLAGAHVTIVVAGMDGALPSVIAGLVEGPVIAVPTSVGYGASFHGLSALLTMLNSCAAGLTVVNIDNGFGAAVAAIRVLSRLKTG